MRTSFPITGTARRFVALVLLLWLGGAGCVLGCELAPGGALATDQGSVVSQEEALSCPTAPEDDRRRRCCHSPAANGAGSSSGSGARAARPTTTTGTMSCCPLAGQPALASKPRSAAAAAEDDAPALVLTSGPFLVVPRRAAPDVSSRVGRRRVPDKGGTHLMCCVFLI